MNHVTPYLKAVVGFFVPGAAALLAAQQDATPGGSAITSGEWLGALLTAVVVSGAVWATPNKDRHGQHQAESVQPPQA